MAVIDNLRVSEQEMLAAINTFESKKAGLENAYLKISNEVRVLDGTFHGQASEIFKAQFDGLYKNLQQSETVMTNVVSKLKNALGVIKENEESIVGMINNQAEGTAYTSNL